MSDVNATATATSAEAQAIEQAVETVLAAQPASAATDATVEAWFTQYIHDSPVSRDTETYNYVRAAVDALKKELAG